VGRILASLRGWQRSADIIRNKQGHRSAEAARHPKICDHLLHHWRLAVGGLFLSLIHI